MLLVAQAPVPGLLVDAYGTETRSDVSVVCEYQYHPGTGR
jgi:hypothetical protein